MTSTKYALPVILFTLFLDMLGIGILIPVIPLLLADPSSPYYLLPAGWSVQQGYLLLGILTAAFPLAQFIAAPVLGQLSDRYGRKPILVISLVGTCLSYAAFAVGIMTRNIPLLFISRFFDGLTGGNIAVAQAALADVTKPEERAKTFGLMGAVFGLGFIIGPYLGGKLSDPDVLAWFNAATPFWFAACLSALNILSVALLLPETHRAINRLLSIIWHKALHNIFGAFRLKKLRVMFGTMFLFSAGFSFFTTFFGVFMIERFGYDQGDIGNFFAFVGLWVIITQGFVTRLVSRYFQESQVLRVALLGCGLMVLSYVLPRAGWQLYAIVPLFALFNGLAGANMMGLLSRSAGADIQGEVMGINSSVGALGNALPPIISGFVAAQTSAVWPTLIAGVLIMGAGAYFNMRYRKS